MDAHDGPVVPVVTGAVFPFLQATSVLLRAGGANCLVDCGGERVREALLQALGRRGVAPARVELLVLTHLHFDHCENADAFPQARVLVHWREVDCARRLLRALSAGTLEAELRVLYERIHAQYLRLFARSFARHAARYRALLADDTRLQLLEGETSLAAGLTAVPTPGHSPGHMSVRVDGPAALWIAGDAVASRREWLGQVEQPDLCWRLDEFARARARLAASPGTLLPGHDAPFEVELEAGLGAGARAPGGVAREVRPS